MAFVKHDTSGESCKNWCYSVQAIFNKLGCREYCACNMPMNKRNMIQKVSSLSLEAYVNKWSDSINN